MRTFGVMIVVALVVGTAGATIMMQGGVIDELSGEVVTDYKTEPMMASDVAYLMVGLHSTGEGDPLEHWAGARVVIHLADAMEVDVGLIVPVLPSTPGGAPVPIHWPVPPSSGQTSSVVSFSVYGLAAQNSGTPIFASEIIPLFELVLHAKNTDFDDVSVWDIQFSFANIFHEEGSNFRTSDLNTAGIDIVHERIPPVPDPASSFVLLLCGVSAALGARGLKRRRERQS